MPEVFAISDRYTVLRNGEFVAEGFIRDTDPHAITSFMVGKQYVDTEVYQPRPLGDVVLKLEGFSGEGFEDINLEAKRGEIVAFTGLAGCGASELMQTMFGVLPSTGGTFSVYGKPLQGPVVSFMKNSVAMLPSNRKENSVVPDMSIMENFYLAEHEISKRKKPFINTKEELARYSAKKEALRIKAGNSSDSISSLSGGNQQKVFLARWLNIGADILLFDNPTQGVDVGAKEEIYKLILDFAQQGKTVIINTLEIPEIQKVADRCVVFYEGKIVKIFDHSEVNEHNVMMYSTNAIETTREGSSHE
jgi:ribose transport system ATP-binding protein